MAYHIDCDNDPCVCPDEEKPVELMVTIDEKTSEAIKQYAGSGSTAEEKAAIILIGYVRFREQGGSDHDYLLQ